MPGYTCSQCGTPFTAQRRRRAAPTCSPKCRWAAERRARGQKERNGWRRTGTKLCPSCGVEKPVSDYTIRKDRNAPVDVCKPCGNERTKRWTRTVAGRAAYYARKYGVTVEWVEETLAKQRNRCAICRQKRRLHLDHDHQDGRARGFLCRDCNVAIGLLREDPVTMRNAITYLWPGDRRNT